MAGPFRLFRLRPRNQRELATRTEYFRTAVPYTVMTYASKEPSTHRPEGDPSYLRLLVLLNVASQGLLGLIAPLTKEFAADLGVTLRTIGDIQTIFLVVYALSTPFWAFMAARVSRHRILVVVSLLWGSCCYLVTLTHDPRLFAIGFALAAIGNAAVVPTTFSMAVDVVQPTRRGAAFGWLATAQTISLGVAFLVGGMLGESYGWRLPFMIFGGLGILSSVSLLTWKRYEPCHGAMEGELQELFDKGKAYTYRIRWRDVRLLLKPLSNLWLLLATVLFSIPGGAVNFWFIAMLRHDHQFDAHDATALLIGLYSIQVPGAVLAGKLADRLARNRVDGKLRLLLGFMVATIPCYLIAFLLPWGEPSLASPAFWTFLVFALLGAFATCAVPPLLYNTIGDVNPPEKRGVTFATISIARLLGRAVGVQFATLVGVFCYSGAISPGIGWSALFGIPAAVCLIPAICSAPRDHLALSGHLKQYVASHKAPDAAPSTDGA